MQSLWGVWLRDDNSKGEQRSQCTRPVLPAPDQRETQEEKLTPALIMADFLYATAAGWARANSEPQGRVKNYHL